MATTHLDQERVSQGAVHMDAIRGLAALIVFVSHTRALYFSSALAAPSVAELSATRREPPALGMLQGKVMFANEAVIIFFALSGYLVGGSVLRAVRSGRWSWRSYLTKRLTRLLIVLVPAIALGVLLDRLGIFWFGPGSIYDTSMPMPITDLSNVALRLKPSVILGNLFFVQTILVEPLGTNLSLWSLASEFWYYLIFPLGLLSASSSFRRSTRIWSGIGAFVLLWFVGWRIAAFFPVWILGAMVAVLPKRGTVTRNRWFAVLATGLLLLSMAGVRLAKMDVIPALSIIGVATCALIYFLIQDKTEAKDGLYPRTARYFSHISYSLYLFHLPIAVFLCAWMDTPWHLWTRTPRNVGVWVLSEGLILLLVTGLWRLFEARTDTVRAWVFGEESGRRHGSAELAGGTGALRVAADDGRNEP